MGIRYGLYYFGFSRMVTKEVEDFKLGLLILSWKKKKNLGSHFLLLLQGGLLSPLPQSAAKCLEIFHFLPPTHGLTLCKQTAIFALQIAPLRSSATVRSCMTPFFLPYLCKSSLLADAPSLLSSGVCGTVNTLLLCLFAFRVDMFSSSDCFSFPVSFSSRLMCLVNCVDVLFCQLFFFLFLSALYFPNTGWAISLLFKSLETRGVGKREKGLGKTAQSLPWQKKHT